MAIGGSGGDGGDDEHVDPLFGDPDNEAIPSMPGAEPDDRLPYVIAPATGADDRLDHERGARPPLVLIFVVAVCVSLVVGGMFWGWLSYRFITDSVRAEATVVDRVATLDSDDEIENYWLDVVFVSDDGIEVQTSRSWGSTLGVPEVGDTVSIHYDPDDPTDIRFARFLDLWLGPLLLFGFGALFLVGIHRLGRYATR